MVNITTLTADASFWLKKLPLTRVDLRVHRFVCLLFVQYLDGSLNAVDVIFVIIFNIVVYQKGHFSIAREKKDYL